VADPNHLEEAVMNGKLVLGVNPYREICTLHMAGQMVIEKVKPLGKYLGYSQWVKILFLGNCCSLGTQVG